MTRRTLRCRACRHWSLIETDDVAGTVVVACDSCGATIIEQVQAAREYRHVETEEVEALPTCECGALMQHVFIGAQRFLRCSAHCSSRPREGVVVHE